MKSITTVHNQEHTKNIKISNSGASTDIFKPQLVSLQRAHKSSRTDTVGRNSMTNAAS